MMPTKMNNFTFKMVTCVKIIWKLIREAIIISLIQHFEADFLWKVSLKILNSGLILKTFTHAFRTKRVFNPVWMKLGWFSMTQEKRSSGVQYDRRKLRPWGYKACFMINSTEHEISTAHKTKIPTKEEVSCLKSLRCWIYHANKC